MAHLTMDYTEDDTKKAFDGLKNNKAHGSDGIPGEIYKILRKQLRNPLTKIMDNVKTTLTFQTNR